MRRTILVSIIALLLNLLIYPSALSQAPQPTSIPSSNALSLGIYGDIPVSHFSGVPNISVPLYEIKGTKINVPITLNYHSAGIYYNIRSGTFGQNWSLHAGGAISRQVRGTKMSGPTVKKKI